MQILRVPTHELSVFRTFDGYPIPEFLEVQTASATPALLEELPNLGLGIVGTRHPQQRSLELLEASLRGLRGSPLVILSGFARGIDSAAHWGAIQNGLRTIAILGCGIDIDYPRENRFLRESILRAGGMLLSPFARGTPPMPRNFHERNGLIAGFSKALWVVEAAAVSGTLNTASWAMRFNRNLYATSCFPADPFFEGNEKLLSQRRPDAYPVAEGFFGIHSLESTWSDLGSAGGIQESLSLAHEPLTQFQSWALEIKHEFGECRVQALWGRALEQGVGAGSFYLALEREIEAGLLRRDQDGRIEVVRRRTDGR